MKQTAKRIGDCQVVENTDRHRAAKEKYNFVRIQDEGGHEMELLFTDNEILRARARAIRNPEDLPAVSKIRNFFD